VFYNLRRRRSSLGYVWPAGIDLQRASATPLHNPGVYEIGSQSHRDQLAIGLGERGPGLQRARLIRDLRTSRVTLCSQFRMRLR
jgi:hypothetical protein